MNILHTIAVGIAGVFQGHHFSAAGVALVITAVFRALAGDWLGAATSGAAALAAFGLHVTLPPGWSAVVEQVLAQGQTQQQAQQQPEQPHQVVGPTPHL